MDFGIIKEIGSAFLVGATILLVLEGYLYFCAEWTITGFFKLPIGFGGSTVNLPSPPAPGVAGVPPAPPPEKVEGMQLGAFVGIATIIGLICQSAFQSLIDNADFPIHALPTSLSQFVCDPSSSDFACLPDRSSKNNLRLSVLYQAKAFEGSPPAGGAYFKIHEVKYEWTATPLLKEIASQDLVPRYCPKAKIPSSLDELVDAARPGAVASDGLRDCLIALYYLSKNWSFTQQPLYDELKEFQARIDFARTFSLACVSLVPWAFVFYFAAFALQIWTRRTQAAATFPAFEKILFGGKVGPSALQRLSLHVLAAAIVLAAGVTCMWAFDAHVLGEDSRPIWAQYWFGCVSGLVTLGFLLVLKREWHRDWPGLRRSGARMAALAVVLVVLHLAGYYAYAWDEAEYAKRAYGYFVTHAALEPRRPTAAPVAVHWFRDSAEQQAVYLEIYRAAAAAVESRRARLAAGTQWGVVLDVDETVLDNSDYQQQIAVAAIAYEPASFDTWVRMKHATALPGVQSFLGAVKAQGGKIVLVTNRRMAQCAATEDNLRAVRIPFDAVLCDAVGDGNKTGRFREVLAGTAATAPLKILAWIGDNIDDFPDHNQKNKGKPSEFGDDYFVLPNPMYGSWTTNSYR